MPNPTRFPQGSRVKLKVAWSAEGVAVDPTTSVEIKDPNGVLSTPSVTQDGVGAYHSLVDCDVAGVWRYEWVAAGSFKGAAPGSFTVDRALVP